MRAVWRFSTKCLLTICLLAWGCCAPLSGQMIVFQENFDQLPLGPPEDEDVPGFTQAFTHQPPLGWEVQRTMVPGIGNPFIGVAEWEGWSFADRQFWTLAANDEGRSQFSRAQGTVAVADPDEWNDLGDPANEIGFYDTFMTTPTFDIDELRRKGSRLQFQLDSSWRPQCCDDGDAFAPGQNNKTATIIARFNDGTTQELLRWESARFFDSAGNPTNDPTPDVNLDFKPTNLNELLFVDLSDLISSTINQLNFSLEFGLTNAGDDWWWAMDNMQMISLTTVDGDMNLDGTLDLLDIPDFAQAMHNEFDYIVNHYGELPATRGSPDSTFDFDDIDWFVGELNDAGFAASRDTVVAAIQAYAVPEPSAACLTATLLCSVVGRRKIVS